MLFLKRIFPSTEGEKSEGAPNQLKHKWKSFEDGQKENGFDHESVAAKRETCGRKLMACLKVVCISFGTDEKQGIYKLQH